MTEPSQKAKSKAEREARLAENLRANLRRRKAVARKKKTSEKALGAKDKSDNAPESP